MSRINFILTLGSTEAKLSFICVTILFFFFIPTITKKQEDIIAMSIGIIAASLLFFKETYFFAIPLIIVFAGIYKKQRIWLTLSYYATISTPVQMMQYMKYIYNEEYKTNPPLYVPLSDIFNDIQTSMKEISINEISKVLEIIVAQFKENQPIGRALTEYMNSIPGVIIFLIIISSLVSITAYMMSNSLKIIESMEAIKKYSKYLEIFFSVITVTIITTLFFIFLVTLQEPLSYRAEINIYKMSIGILGAAITTLPISFINYEIKISTAVGERSMEIIKNSEKLIERIKQLRDLIKKIGHDLPVKVDALEMELLILDEKIKDILNNIKFRLYGLNELENKIKTVKVEVNEEINVIYKKLNIILDEYRRNENYEFNILIENFKKIGIVLNDGFVVNYDEDDPVEIKIQNIKEMLSKEWKITERITEIYSQIYYTMRIFFDPLLPEENPTLNIAKQKIQEREDPCIVLEALLVSLNNLEQQYSTEINNFLNKIFEVVSAIEKELEEKEKLTYLFKEKCEMLIEAGKKVNTFKEEKVKSGFKTTKIVTVKQVLVDYIKAFREMFTTFYDELIYKENQIEKISTECEIEWRKQAEIKEKILYLLSELNENLIFEVYKAVNYFYKILSIIDECFETISKYDEIQEFLVNYKFSEEIIKRLLSEKGMIKICELPFKEEFAKEYIESYYEKNKMELIYDTEKNILYRRGYYET